MQMATAYTVRATRTEIKPNQENTLWHHTGGCLFAPFDKKNMTERQKSAIICLFIMRITQNGGILVKYRLLSLMLTLSIVTGMCPVIAAGGNGAEQQNPSTQIQEQA